MAKQTIAGFLSCCIPLFPQAEQRDRQSIGSPSAQLHLVLHVGLSLLGTDPREADVSLQCGRDSRH